jgi:hypothetical protein
MNRFSVSGDTQRSAVYVSRKTIEVAANRQRQRAAKIDLDGNVANRYHLPSAYSLRLRGRIMISIHPHCLLAFGDAVRNRMR